MNDNMNRPEIVAPAGSAESFAAAIDAGADAVYAGAPGFNMRAGAEVLDIGRIREMTGRAHDAGSKLYLAMNTLIYDDEIDNAVRMLDEVSRIDVDAVILWDHALLASAAERGLRAHLSTQASVANARTAAVYESQGVSRIVLARELSLERIARTVSETRKRGSSLEFEVFVHGAMCVAVSGRCLMSQFLAGRSANRGDCIQPCRRTYRVTDMVNGNELELDGHTVMSARDLCTIDILDKIIAAGVSALKIEGRMRDGLYVKTAVECYREARDAVLDGTFDAGFAQEMKVCLERVFNRGFSSGFYLRPPHEDIASDEGNVATVMRVYAGRVDNYYPRAKAADIRLEARGVAVGDTLLVTGPTTGALEFTLESLRSEDNRGINSSTSGVMIGIAVPDRVREGDSLYVLVDRASASADNANAL